MPQHGFSSASDEGLISLDAQLDQNAWGALPAPDPSTPAHLQPALSVHKARIQATIRTFVVSRLADLTPFDDDWDRAQRRLSLTLSLHEESRDPTTRHAATRLRDKLLQGGRVQQTNLSYGDEIEFGEAQHQLAQAASLRDDIERLALQDILAEIQRTTQALREALALNSNKRTAAERTLSTRRARVAIHDACNDALDLLAWLQHQPDADRATLDALTHTLRSVLP